MKIIQSSNVRLGALFSGQAVPGDKLRVAIKNAFVRLIDLTIAEKADLLILAGDTFDSPDISQNLLEFFLDQIRRLEKIPAVVLPGARDPYQKGSFWEEWHIISPVDNLHLLADTEKPHIEIASLSATIYGYPVQPDSAAENPTRKIKKFGKSKYHIGVVYGNLIGQASEKKDYAFSREDLDACGFDYNALGGQDTFFDFTLIGAKAAYSGSPEILSSNAGNTGKCALINLDENSLTIEPKENGSLIWKEAEVSMEKIVGPDELRQKIDEMAGPNVILKVTLEGLALFESGLNLQQINEEMKGNFLDLEFVDQTKVLPDISEIKVQEKTILGQYLKVMVERLRKTEGDQRRELEESLKTGYTLLTGKEVW